MLFIKLWKTMHILNKEKDSGGVVFIDFGNNRAYPSVSHKLLDYLGLDNSMQYVDFFDILKKRGYLDCSFVDTEHVKGYYVTVKSEGHYYKEITVLRYVRSVLNGIVFPIIVSFLVNLIISA